ncbi:uncharacterized mitochondrial protein AtMg00810-like [Humulus lupulus]|uniref:uncharacterized mitochondrial protein AtMg00810-like n=1 Tax=Humulus lupulus TaxID=3486 RepID=UPI002B414E66|nr:uncharacterized mitochondrial protein AtMg00810-like [Humulus lupulus]
MKDEFEMSMVGELNYLLGFQVKQSKDGTFISQSKYAKNLVKKFCMESAKHVKTPMGTMVKLTKDENGVKVVPKIYKSMIRSLLYLTASQPNISYSVGVCARYQGNLMESHVTDVTRIIHYVNGTLEYEIMYPKETNSNLVCFSDANWAAMMKTRRNGSRSIKDSKATPLTTTSSLTKTKARKRTLSLPSLAEATTTTTSKAVVIPDLEAPKPLIDSPSTAALLASTPWSSKDARASLPANSSDHEGVSAKTQ